MAEYDTLALIAGIIMTIGGVGLLIISLFILPLLVYAIIVLIIGIVILATLKQQQHIEPIKNEKSKKPSRNTSK